MEKKAKASTMGQQLSEYIHDTMWTRMIVMTDHADDAT
jgi:hypothetical protein